LLAGRYRSKKSHIGGAAKREIESTTNYVNLNYMVLNILHNGMGKHMGHMRKVFNYTVFWRVSELKKFKLL
jgi:hypothetical protein